MSQDTSNKQAAALMGSGPNGEFLEPGTCDNITSTGQCNKKAEDVCKGCLLVQYCGLGCQRDHWTKHKLDCEPKLASVDWLPTWTQQKRRAFGSGRPKWSNEQYLWGNVPEYDILNLPKNEGIDYDKDLQICFAASGDLRNVMSTVLALPDKLERECQIVINDRDRDVVLRNAVILLLAFNFPGGEASELIVHFWYSAALPSAMHDAGIAQVILPQLLEFSVTKQFKSARENLPLIKAWITGNSTLRLTLLKEEWLYILAVLKPRKDLSFEKAQKHRAELMLASSNLFLLDTIDAICLITLPHRRLVSNRWRETGMLLPYGYSTEGFDVINASFFNLSNKWKLNAWGNHNPISGTYIPINQTSTNGAPFNNLSGRMFFERRNLVTEFCRVLPLRKLRFHQYLVDVTELPATLKLNHITQSFDRIDVSNIADQIHLGIKATLTTVGPMLKSKSENPRATLLMCLMCCDKFIDKLHSPRKPDSYTPSPHRKEQLKQYVHFWDDKTPSAPLVEIYMEFKENMGYRLFRDLDIDYEQYKEVLKFSEVAKGTTLMEKETNTIIEKLPLKIHISEDDIERT